MFLKIAKWAVVGVTAAAIAVYLLDEFTSRPDWMFYWLALS